MAIDEGKLNEFLGRFVSDLGATIAAGGIVIGHRLGLFHALARGPGDGRRARPAHRDQSPLHRGVAAAARRRAATCTTTRRMTPTR